jgi:uncharacterized protein (DUF2141 family)
MTIPRWSEKSLYNKKCCCFFANAKNQFIFMQLLILEDIKEREQELNLTNEVTKKIMKTKHYVLGMACLLIGATMLLSSCTKDPVIVDKVTKITGTAKLQAGTVGNLLNAQVAIYMSVADWTGYNPLAIAENGGTNGAKITFVFNDVVPGNYYLDVWSDEDGDQQWSLGDLVGWYGSGAKNSPALSPFMVAEGKTYNHTIAVVVL